MKATQQLPPGYRTCLNLDLTKNGPLLLWLNLAGLAILPIAAWLFLSLTSRLRPEFSFAGWSGGEVGEAIMKIIALLAVFVGVIVLHELIHGLFFWVFTGKRAVFGFRVAYAFAGAPSWYIPRNPYLIVGLSPLVVISLVGIFLIPWVPYFWLGILILGLLINATGAVGDLAVVGWLMLRGHGALVQDFGDALIVYCPAEAP